jgi:hypothetical protein
MKILILMVISFALLDCSKHADLANKSQTKWKTNSNWEKTEKEEEKQFNENADIVKWIQYTSSGEICEEFKYEYEGKIKVKEYRKGCNQDDSKAKVTNFKYGANHRIEEEIEFENKKMTEISKFKYRQKSDKYPIQREDYFNGETEPIMVANLTYDKPGNLIKEEQFVSGSWFGTFTYKFNSGGQLIYSTCEADGGVGLVEYFYIYKNNVLIKDSVKIPGAKTEYHIYETKTLKEIKK